MGRRHDPETVTENWRAYLMTGDVPPSSIVEQVVAPRTLRRLMQRLPSDPRCKSCRLPFRGMGGRLMRALGRHPSNLNPRFCDICDRYISENVGGAEVELTMLFADVRGSTGLAERMKPADYGALISRFYREVTNVLVRADALIEKLIGDEVTAMFVPGFAGANHAQRAVGAARAILEVTGHRDREGPWIPVGIGVHGGTAYVGAVGSEDGITDIVALGDTVNTAARLASSAGVGDLLVSSETLEGLHMAESIARKDLLDLKGRSDPVEVCVMHVGPEEGA